MNKNILARAIKKFNRLKPMYTGFITVGVDNWRGYRFIYDTRDVRRCTNNCAECPLYNLVKNESKGLFTASLIRATEEDKRMFGNQNQLNCKTLKQYTQCFVAFLTKNANSPGTIKQELRFIKNVSFIYSSEYKNLRKLEYNFRKDIMQESLRRIRGIKRQSSIHMRDLVRLIEDYD